MSVPHLSLVRRIILTTPFITRCVCLPDANAKGTRCVVKLRVSRRRAPDTTIPATFATMRWVIGDIHGMLKPLAQLIYAVRAQDSQARFLFVGDYVNRGPDSRGVVDLLLRLPAGTARFARGKHGYIVDLILNGKSFASGADPVPVFAWFMAHGLDRTLHSYGIDDAMIAHVPRTPCAARLVDLVESIPQDHRTFFRHLPLVIEEHDLF